MRAPLNLQRSIAEHRDLLKPPVGNAQIWQDSEFIVTVVGGPNLRTDYHDDPGEEFFYQLDGDIVLRIIADGRPTDLTLRAGEVFLLPPHVRHSPQRPAGSVGLVIERVRRPGEIDFSVLIHVAEVVKGERIAPLRGLAEPVQRFAIVSCDTRAGSVHMAKIHRGVDLVLDATVRKAVA